MPPVTPANTPARPVVPAENFLTTLAANVDNAKLSDAAFRELVRNTLPIVVFPRPDSPKPAGAAAPG